MAYKSQTKSWRANQASRLAAYQKARANRLNAAKSASAGRSRGPEQNMEVGNHLTFGNDIYKALTTTDNVFTPYLMRSSQMKGMQFTSNSSKPIQTLSTSQVGSSPQMKGTVIYPKATKSAKGTRQDIKTPKVKKGFTFLGYDKNGNPKYRNNAEYAQEQTPWLTKDMNFDKKYTPKSEEEAMQITGDPYEQQILLNNFYKSKGIDTGVDNLPANYEEDLKLFKDEQNKDKSRLEQQIANATSTAKKQVASQEAGVKAELLPGREGVVSQSNIAGANSIVGNMDSALNQQMGDYQAQLDTLNRLQEEQRKKFSSGRANMIREQMQRVADAQASIVEAQNKQREDTMGYLKMMQDSGALAYADQDTLNYLSQGLPGAPQGFIGMLSNAATRSAMSEDKQKMFDNQQSAITTLKSLADEGMYLTPELVKQYSDATGLPFETIYAFNENADRIRQDNQMDNATKQMNLQKLSYELDREARGITTGQLQNIDYLTDLYRRGASPDEISMVKNALGIKDMDDPMYQLQFKEQVLKNQASEIALNYLPAEKAQAMAKGSLDYSIKQIDALMKSEDWKNYPKKSQLELEKLKLDLQQVSEEKKEKFGQGVYVSNDPKAKVKASFTPDGIRVNVKSGQDGGQCGTFVNDYLGERIIGNSYDQKMSLTDPNIKTPSPGMVFVMPASGKSAPYGHTGIIEKVYANADGEPYMQVVESNFHNNEKIQRRQMPVSSASGFIVPPSSDRYSVGKTGTPAEKLNAMESRMPDAYKWIGTSMDLAYNEKAPEKLERVLSLIDQNRGEEASNVVYGAIMKDAPPEKLASLKNTIQSFQELDKAYTDFQKWADKTGFKPSKINSWETEANIYFKRDIPEEFYSFYRKVNESFAEYLKSISGVAVSEQEANRIRKLFGDPNLPITQNKVTMDQLLSKANGELNQFVRSFSDEQVKSWQDLDEKLNSVRNLDAKDLKVDDYSTYYPGDISSVLKNNPETYTYALYSSSQALDPKLFNRY